MQQATNAAQRHGRKIAFVSNRLEEADYHPENGDIYTISPSGRALRQVTKRFGPISMPTWSLDSKRLYYVGHFGGDGEMLRHPLHISHQLRPLLKTIRFKKTHRQILRRFDPFPLR